MYICSYTSLSPFEVRPFLFQCQTQSNDNLNKTYPGELCGVQPAIDLQNYAAFSQQSIWIDILQYLYDARALIFARMLLKGLCWAPFSCAERPMSPCSTAAFPFGV
jgi:hypothetical protein